ncbi:MAG: M67 family metallopeptidase [Planctomycetes bacterium]|nr:M67 family metallopeptidase [Planctomycetota bacterium]
MSVTPRASAASTPADVDFPRALFAELEAWSRESHPFEACGLLFGRRATGRIEVVAVRRYPNVAGERARDRFEIAPRDLMAADREACALGLGLVGTWHSHPDHPATPSAHDRAAAWPDGLLAIVSVSASGNAELLVFQDSGERALAACDRDSPAVR